jgi:hypothetical protein
VTTPSQIRSILLRLGRRAKREIQQVATSSTDPAIVRSALFAATPIIVSEYVDGSSALALEWYDELRAEAAPPSPFTPTPLVLVTDENVAAIVAQTTSAINEIQQGIERQLDEAVAESVRLLTDETERLVAEAFRETMIANVVADPSAAGWRRFARPEACKFCLMLAARGAVYTSTTARFAAHSAVMSGNRKGGNCMCIAGPEFGDITTWVEATPLQYTASQTTRTDQQRADLRAYLNKNFPDAPG